MQATKRQCTEVSQLWQISELKGSLSNLVLSISQVGTDTFFTIGSYSYNSITGLSRINPLNGCNKLSYSQVKTLLM